MSVSELRQAAPVRINPTRHDERLFKRIARESSVLAYVPRFNWLGHSFELRFGFGRDARLNRIFLVAPDNRFQELAAALTAIHGAPLAQADAPLPCRVWRDAAQGDHVRLRWTGVTVFEQAPAAEAAAVCPGAGRTPGS